MRITKPTKRQKAHILSKGVEVEGVGNKSVYYRVVSGNDDYSVTLHLTKRLSRWTCTCVHGSLYPGGVEGQKCSHIIAVEMRQEREGKITWN